jgi:hypothetical protein
MRPMLFAEVMRLGVSTMASSQDYDEIIVKSLGTGQKPQPSNDDERFNNSMLDLQSTAISSNATTQLDARPAIGSSQPEPWEVAPGRLSAGGSAELKGETRKPLCCDMTNY